MAIPQLPSLNYKTVYFFVLSVSVIILILSLTGNIKIVNNQLWLATASILSIFFSLIAWIVDGYLTEKYKMENYLTRNEKLTAIYRRNQVIIFILLATGSSISFIFALWFQ